MTAHGRILERVLRAEGIPAASAAQIAERVAAELRRELGGVKAYIACERPSPAALARRAAELRDAGHSVRDIAARLGRSRSNVWALLQKHDQRPAPAGAAPAPRCGSGAALPLPSSKPE